MVYIVTPWYCRYLLEPPSVASTTIAHSASFRHASGIVGQHCRLSSSVPARVATRRPTRRFGLIGDYLSV